MKKVSVAFLFLCAFLFSGCWQKQAQPEDSNFVPEQQENLIPEVVQPTNLTYKNEEYGFEFEYPQEVDVREIGNRLRLSNQTHQENGEVEGYWEIVLFENKGSATLEDWFSDKFEVQENTGCKELDSNISIENGFTMLFSSEDALGVCSDGGYYTISPDRRTVIKWELGQDPGYSESVLSSFRFIE